MNPLSIRLQLMIGYVPFALLGSYDHLTDFLANPGRDLTAKERKEWERNICQYQISNVV